VTRAAALAAALALAATCGCGAPPARAPAGAGPSAPLASLVPAAGLRWLVLARPAEWLRGPLQTATERVVPPSELAAIERATGVAPARAASAAAAGFDGTTLLLAEATDDPATVEKRFRERMDVLGERREPRPGVVVLTGRGAARPEALLLVGREVVGLAEGGPGPARVAEAYALGLLRAPSALAAPPLDDAARRLGDAPLRLLLPGPFEPGAHGLLAGATAVAFAAVPIDASTLRLRAIVVGDWHADRQRAARALEATWGDVAASSLGRLLGLDRPRSPPQIDAADDQLALQVDLAPDPLAWGLSAALGAQVRDIMSLPRR
jgi:hypothetical protein